MLIDFVTESIRHILLDDADVISRLVASRKRCEPWLQIEVFKRYIRRFPDIEIVLEQAYTLNSRERCDLWCREADGRESWVELKTCVTNYQREYGPKSARDITNQIFGVIRDVERLRKLPLEFKRHLFLLAYPMPATGDPPLQWLDHLSRVRDKGGKITPVLTGSLSARVLGYTIAA